MTKKGEARAFFELALLLETDDCILWPFGTNGNGYAFIQINGKLRKTSAEILLRKLGPKPKNMESAHSCRNRACINYRHLSYKTHKKNMEDKLRDQTSNRGTKASRNRLTENHVHWIRRQFDLEVPIKRIAFQLEMNQSSIWDIKYERHWSWLARQEPYVQIWEDLK